MENPASLTIQGRLGKIRRFGIPLAFEQMQTVLRRTCYRVELVPRLAMLAQTENNRIFLDKAIPRIISEVLTGAGLAEGADFAFRLSRTLNPREYVVQYQETDFDFISRLMERDGLYFYFDHTGNREKCIITDTKAAHSPQAVTADLRYAPASGMDQEKADATVADFFAAQHPMPQYVQLRDWNYRTPDVELEAKAPVIDSGFGLTYLYGDHFGTPAEGQALSRIRAEEHLCRQRLFTSRSFSPYFDPGFTFRLSEHGRSDFNQTYLTIEATRSGRQPIPGLPGILAAEGENGDNLYYRTTLKAIPGNVQFRAERRTPWPRLAGVMPAVIDGAGSGQYPELDADGRYKIIAAHDASGRKDGMASAFVRMAQPYGGPDHGLHCPLHKGCEVLLAHVDGDPDRPIILAAAPNPDNPSPVRDANQTKSRLLTSSGNELHFEDNEGEKRILFNVPATSSFMRMGAPNDPADWKPNRTDPKNDSKDEGQHGWKISTPDWITIMCGAQLELYMIGYISSVVGFYQDSIFLSKTELNPAFVQKFYGYKCKTFPGERKNTVLANLFCATTNQISTNKQHLATLKQDIIGELQELNGTLEQLHAEITTLAGEANELAAEVTRLAATTTTLLGETTDINQVNTRLVQENATLAGQITQMAQSQMTVAAETRGISGQVTVMAQTITKVAGQTTSTAIQVMQTAVNQTRLNGMDLTV
jgi:type VI secretion system secreted protein VgrG